MSRRAFGRTSAAGVVCAIALLGWGATPSATARAAEAGAAAAGNGKAADASKPAYQVIDVEGLKGLLHKARGRVVVLHFWASWCYPCLQELPLIDKFAHEMKPRGLELLSISLDDPARMGPRVAALLRKSAPHLTATIVQFGDADELIGAIDPRWPGAIPALFAYDHHGQPHGSLIGAATRAELDGLVGALLKAAAESSPAEGAPGPGTGAKK